MMDPTLAGLTGLIGLGFLVALLPSFETFVFLVLLGYRVCFVDARHCLLLIPSG